MDSKGDPTADDMLAVVELLKMQGAVLMDGVCRSCGKHPLLVFAPPFEVMVDGQNDYEACVHCDYMHLWPRFEDQYFEDECLECKRCGKCELHDCGGCLTRDELLDLGYTEEEIDDEDN